MELIYILLFFSVDFLSVMLATGKPDPPKDIRIHVNGSTAKVSWTIPTNQGIKWSLISLEDSNERNVMNKYVPSTSSSFEIVNLKMCSEYNVRITCTSGSQRSEFSTQKFWMTNELEPPQNVTIQVVGNNAKISWTITTNQEVNTSLISLFISNGTKVAIDSSNNYKYLEFPVTSYDIINLTLCSEYVVKIEYQSRGVWSGVTEKKFWMTTNTVHADTNENVTVAWTTGITFYYNVLSPSLNSIYAIQGNSFITNFPSAKYKYDNLSTTDVQKINISIINVNETDAGLYITEDNNHHVDGCCLLVVTAKPIKPTLNLNPEHPFVGDNITLTCHSTVQQWPVDYSSSHLLYQFNGYQRGTTDNNMFTLHTLSMSDKGTNITCQATDDHHKVSNKSKTITLDPYYAPDNVVLKPGHKYLNITEGNKLGPINCTASCNPKCLFKWKLNRTGTFEDVLSSETLVVANIMRNQSGIYRCRGEYRHRSTKPLRADISVNVQYSPKITLFWIAGTETRNPTTYRYNEGLTPGIGLHIESNPEPQLVLSSSSLTFSPYKYTKQSNNLLTQLPRLKCEHSGNFTIQARNGILYGDNKTVNFIISCKPRDAETRQQIVGTKVNTNVNIDMNLVSFPAPNVTWIRMTKFKWTVRIDKFNYRHKISSTIQIKSESEFGKHGIKICNTLGCIVENITFIPEDKPEAPQNVSSEAITFKSVNLSWIAGFNGGDRQTFSVLFKTVDDDKWDTRIVQTNDTRTGNIVYYSLDQLTPDTSYQVMVLSTNKNGKRNASLEFKTEVEPTLSSPSSASISPLSIGIGCGIAVLVLTIILLVFIIRRKKSGKTESKECSVLYAEVDKEQHKGKKRKQVKEDSDEPANTEYASVVKSKSKKVHYKEDAIETENNEYAVVDKSNKGYTENESVYANQDDEQLIPHKPLEAQLSGRSTNQDGLTYIEVSFTSNQSDRRPIIGAESKTDYVDIDFTRKADPLPDDSD